MRLKCIKLSGFKSFVDPTTIDFPSNLCSVVGPNGCGKSNVIDAVRWVMGESSAKNLRGEQMTDVIFNGSGGRKPVGQASVELVFDNSDHKLTGEYANFTEVAIKRKVDRDAQSTYTLNGTKCRRKDITDIFLGTGLGARSYSIIEQGMVSRLIESKPEELRIFIEEAAGISKYKERRKETENRIKRTKDNLERLADIRDELEKQLSHLKRQSVAAEKYGEYKKEERQTTAQLNALRWQSLNAEIQQNQQAISELEIKIEATIAEQRELDAQAEKYLSDNADLNDALGEVQARFYSLGNDIARNEQSIEYHIERTDQLRADLAETEEAFSQTKEEMDIDLKRITQLDAEVAELQPQLSEAEAAEAQASEQLHEAEQALQGWQAEWDQFNSRAEEPRQVAEVEQSRIQQLENIVQRGLERKEQLLNEQENLQDSDDNEQISGVRQQVASLEADLGSLQSEASQLRETISSHRSRISENSNQIDQARSELQQAKGKQSSLEALQQAALGRDNEALGQWLARKGLDNQLRLAESIQITQGWERAVEAVLGDNLQAVCVEGMEQMSSLLADLPGASLSLVDVSSAKSATSGSVTGLPALQEYIESDYGWGDLLSDVFAAESLDQALAARSSLQGSQSIVTRDGMWLGKGWLQVRSGDGKESVIERRGLIADLFKRCEGLAERIEQLQNEEQALKDALADAESSRDSVQEQIAAKTRSLGDLKSQISAELTKIDEAKARRLRVGRELEELERQLCVEQENISASRERLQAALDAMEVNVEARDKLEQNRESAQSRLSDSRLAARSSKDKAHELALKLQSLQSQSRSTRETMDRMASQVQRASERIDSLRSQIDASDAPLQAMRRELEGQLEKRLEVEKELATAKAAVDENEHKLRQLEQRRNGLLEQLGKHRESFMQQKLKTEGASVKRDALQQQLADAGFELKAVLEEMPQELTEQECETALEKLANRIQRLGPINLAAIDEYQQKSERKMYLDKQNEDLEKALTTLENAIRKIDKETRTRFKETFDKVNAGLQDLFPRIFGGGHAYLDMTGEDLLDTGVAIMARPPGKRNSTIHLLSGGEKAMTAIALVFSIFHLNPSPFCMLDEVDAPLDDANVGRYANLVREMSESVQFIFITHNKITMEMANQLLGVTMHEPGVSRIVAVDIEEAAELAAM